MKSKVDKFQHLFGEWKHVLSLDWKGYTQQLNLPFEDSFLTTEEAFIVSEYEKLYGQVCSQICITSEVFIQDFELANVAKDIQACSRVFSAGNAINFERFQKFLNCQFYNIKDTITISMTSLADCTLLLSLRHTAPYYNTFLSLQDMICESLVPLAEQLSTLVVDNFLVSSGILTDEEAQVFLKHALFVQHLIEDNQTFILLLMVLAINDQPQHDSLRRYIGRLLMKKISTKIRADANAKLITDEDGYPKLVDNAIDLIQEKEPLRSSIDIFDDFFQSLTQIKKSMLKLNILNSS